MICKVEWGKFLAEAVLFTICCLNTYRSIVDLRGCSKGGALRKIYVLVVEELVVALVTCTIARRLIRGCVIFSSPMVYIQLITKPQRHYLPLFQVWVLSSRMEVVVNGGIWYLDELTGGKRGIDKAGLLPLGQSGWESPPVDICQSSEMF